MDMEMRYDWSLNQVNALYSQSVLELVSQAASVHRQHFKANEVQMSTLISIKTGSCPEDCHYCPQAARYKTGIEKNALMELAEVKELGIQALEKGSSRVCLGAAWREVKDNKDFDNVLDMVSELNGMGLEVCCTLGMLNEDQAIRLKERGLYAYNHNIDTSEDYYKKIITTRKYEDRLQTLENVRKANLTVCCGGIVGMGESVDDRLKMLVTLSHLRPHPESVPLNILVPVKGTPLSEQEKINFWDYLKIVALARIMMPKTMVRLSAGRLSLSDAEQALCFLAGANSIFAGEKLLTTPNNDVDNDKALFDRLGIVPKAPSVLQEQDLDFKMSGDPLRTLDVSSKLQGSCGIH